MKFRASGLSRNASMLRLRKKPVSGFSGSVFAKRSCAFCVCARVAAFRIAATMRVARNSNSSGSKPARGVSTVLCIGSVR